MAERGHPQTRWLVSCVEEPLAEARLVGLDVRHTREGLEFSVLDRQTGEQQLFATTLIGLHNVTNILLATAVALQEGMNLKEIAMRVATLSAPDHRLRRNTLPNGVTILDDAYNTNPVGAANALQVLSLYEEGRRILITPGMVELGPLQAQENEKLGKLAAKYCTDIVLVGIEQTQPIQRGVKSTAFDTNHLLVVDTLKEAIDWYQSVVNTGDAVLFLNDLPDIY
jgi:UDP-N-acetylmuramoyl-tripeptide--D-alanyl-D-alanine ligase